MLQIVLYVSFSCVIILFVCMVCLSLPIVFFALLFFARSLTLSLTYLLFKKELSSRRETARRFVIVENVLHIKSTKIHS